MDTNAALQYYDLVRKLLKAAGDYSGKIKLKENLEDESTAHEVEHVLVDYFKGDINKLNTAIKKRKSKCEDIIKEINAFHSAHKIREIRSSENLILLLRDDYRRRKWGTLIAKHIKKKEFANVFTLEIEYFKTTLPSR